MKRSDPPTARQVLCFQMLVMHRGNFTAAGRELGVDRVAVRESVRGLLRRTRWDGPR